MSRFPLIALTLAWMFLLGQVLPVGDAVADVLPSPVGPTPAVQAPAAPAPKPASASARRGWTDAGDVSGSAEPAAPPPATSEPRNRLVSGGNALPPRSATVGVAMPPAIVAPVSAAGPPVTGPPVANPVPVTPLDQLPQSRLVSHIPVTVAPQPAPNSVVPVSLQRIAPPAVPQRIELLPPPAPTAAPADGQPYSARRPRPFEDKPLAAVECRLAPKPGELPDDVAQARFGRAPVVLDGSVLTRRPVDMNYSWDAPALCYGPIYIQDVNLERYGYSHGVLQAGYSAVQFLGSVAILPYLWGAYPQRNCYYALGYYRPGDYAPYQKSLPRVSLRGVIFEGSVGAAAAFGIPGFIP